MIRNTRQDWEAGKVVKVGFLRLRVLGARAVKDSMPDIYTLESLDCKNRYEFIPHNGLRKLYDMELTECLNRYPRSLSIALYNATGERD